MATLGWLILLTVFAPAGLARACSCGGVVERLNESSCGKSKRAFAGTVAGYRWPSAYGFALRDFQPVRVELAVDRVWRGNVPAPLYASTGSASQLSKRHS